MRRAAAAMVVLAALGGRARGDDAVRMPDGWRLSAGVAERDGANPVRIEYRRRDDLSRCSAAIVPGATLGDDVYGWFDTRHWVLDAVDGTVHVYVCAELPDGKLAWSIVTLASQPAPDRETLGVIEGLTASLADRSPPDARPSAPRAGTIASLDTLLVLTAKLDGGGLGGHLLVPPHGDARVGALFEGSARVVLGSEVHAEVEARGALGPAIREGTVTLAALVGAGADTVDAHTVYDSSSHSAVLASLTPLVRVLTAAGDTYVAQASAAIRSNGKIEELGRVEWHRGAGLFRGLSLEIARYSEFATMGLVGVELGR